MNVISAQQAISLLLNPALRRAIIDVRSEGEFSSAAFPGAINVPILINEHRHLVGLTYKNKGQSQAIELGQELTRLSKSSMIVNWEKHLKNQDLALVYCSRGGLRSKTTCEWIKDKVDNVTRIEGGYKALRNILLDEFEKSHPLMVVSGPTGSGKSEVLRKISERHLVDLEALAKHKGSVFGELPGNIQPTQAQFENELAWSFLNTEGLRFVEDESRLIGRVHLPNQVYAAMAQSDRILLECPYEIRLQNIFREYVKEPLEEGVSSQQLETHLLSCLERIKNRLGGLLHSQIVSQLKQAFEDKEPQAEKHFCWIGELLGNYYDKAYAHAFEKKNFTVVFKGDDKSCLEFMNQKCREKHD